MKQEIIDRLKALGGNIDNVKGNSLQEDLRSISFNTVLYKKPQDLVWTKTDEQEPIVGLGKFWDQNEKLLQSNHEAFIAKIIDNYYRITEEPNGQFFWKPNLFTPFKKDSDDFEEWNEDFIDNDFVDLTAIINHTNDTTPDFMQLLSGFTYPDSYYVCLSDPDKENPTLFGTDQTVFFAEVSNEGTLEDFLNLFMTKEELIQILKSKLSK